MSAMWREAGERSYNERQRELVADIKEADLAKGGGGTNNGVVGRWQQQNGYEWEVV